MKYSILVLLLSLGMISPPCADNLIPLSDSMTNEQKAAQMLLVYYTDLDFAIEHEFGGLLLSRNAFKNVKKLKYDLMTLQKKAITNVIIAVDHEGGLVNRLKDNLGWEETLSAKYLGELPPKSIEKHAEKAAQFLSFLGINMNLAPVIDPATNEDGLLTWMGVHKRSFGESHAQIINSATAYIKAFKKYGIDSIVKHYPAYLSVKNSDTELIKLNTSIKFLASQRYLFEKVSDVSSGTMLANITYSKISNKPAVLEPSILDSARKIYPTGLLITDDLWTNGVRLWAKDPSGKIDKDKELLAVTKEAILAGNDILMITYPEKAVMMKKQIAKWMKTDGVVRIKVNNAVKRILWYKQEKGTTDF